MEVAQAIERLMQTGQHTASVAAKKLGVSPASVSRSLALLTLPEEIQESVHAGRLSASTAYEIAKTTDAARKADLVAEATHGGLRRERAARHSRAPKSVQRPRKRGARKHSARTVLPLDATHQLALVGKDLPLAELVVLLDDLAARLRAVAADPSADLSSALSSLTSK